jgi:hypothetical protein
VQLSLRLRRPAGLLAVAALLGAAGCQSHGNVSGKVTFKGKPLKGGTVVFVIPGKGSVVAPIGEDGSYSAARVPVGDARLSVETKSVGPPPAGRVMGSGPGMGRGMGPGMGPGMQRGPPPTIKGPKDSDLIPDGKTAMSVTPNKGDPKRYVPIPESYADPEKSGLTYAVTGGTQTHDIELK